MAVVNLDDFSDVAAWNRRAPAPTDAELMQVIKDVAKNSAINRDGSTSLRIARAVLAKWGTPAPASQPVAVPIKAGEYPPLVCDYCGALTPDPWHSSGMMNGKMSKHIHSCDVCAALASPAQAGEYPPLVCDYCGALTPDPWHSSGMLHGKMSNHIHSCDSCAAQGGA